MHTCLLLTGDGKVLRVAGSKPLTEVLPEFLAGRRACRLVCGPTGAGAVFVADE